MDVNSRRGGPGASSSVGQGVPYSAFGGSPAGQVEGIRRQGWLLPVLLFLLALFLQNAGLYAATSCYIRHADEIEAKVLGNSTGLSSVEESALDDPFCRMLHSSRLAQSIQGLLTPEFWVDVFTSAVVVTWMCWVIHSRDLQLWSRVLFAGSLLACMKGFLAWSTVVPDSSGWEGCKKRLGGDGLLYFREASGFLQALQDISLLTVRSIWSMGRTSDHRVCADTVFSSSTYSASLFGLGLYSAVHSSVNEKVVARRATVLGLAGLILVAVVAADVAQAVGSRDHYSLDAFLALLLSLLVYGSPVVALAADSWTQACNRGAAGNQWVLVASREPSAETSATTSSAVSLPEFTDGVDVSVAPCCFPFSFFAGTYYLEEVECSRVMKPWTEADKQRQKRQKSQMSASVESTKKQCTQARANLQKAKEAAAAARQAESEARQKVEERIKSEQEQTLAETKEALAREEEAVYQLRKQLKKVGVIERSLAGAQKPSKE